MTWLKDEERTAYGLGWEHRRRGRPLDDNPFPIGHWRHDDYICGWQNFQPSKQADYASLKDRQSDASP